MSGDPRKPRVSQERTHALYRPIYAELNLPVPARVNEFLDGPRPIVYVAITSSGAALVRECAPWRTSAYGYW
jgi:hypothetical protein